MVIQKGRFGLCRGTAAENVIRNLLARLTKPKAVALLSIPCYLCSNEGLKGVEHSD